MATVRATATSEFYFGNRKLRIVEGEEYYGELGEYMRSAGVPCELVAMNPERQKAEEAAQVEAAAAAAAEGLARAEAALADAQERLAAIQAEVEARKADAAAMKPAAKPAAAKPKPAAAKKG